MYIEQRIQPRKALQHIQPYHPGKKFMVLQVFGLVLEQPQNRLFRAF
ncbi:hypothetical protein [Ectobacillus funiculus]|uniref:Uncharacterized protein n=1 Tax=Ectobacillus funiculus TaxID=137993 RepID=A0ABV5WFM3_9BACI